jgi:hypothetical protein
MHTCNLSPRGREKRNRKQFFEGIMVSPAWWFMSIILALERWRQEDHEFKASLGYHSETLFQNKTNKGHFQYLIKNYKSTDPGCSTDPKQDKDKEKCIKPIIIKLIKSKNRKFYSIEE